MTRNDVLASLRENAYLYYQDEEDRHIGDWQDKLYNALLQSLDVSLLAEVTNQLLLEPNCPRSLYYKSRAILSHKVELQNAALSTRNLLRLYRDKGSKKVNLAMKELMRRFRGEDQDKQRIILRTFLQGGKKELEWAGRRLRDNWIPSFAPLVAERWKATHNRILAYVVLRHMPSTFVMEQQEELASATKYAFVCVRLGNVDGFHLDKKRLSIPDYFYVKAKLAAGHSPMVNTTADLESMLQEYLDKETMVGPDDVKTILWAMGKLGMTESIIRFKPEFKKRMKMYEEQSHSYFTGFDY